MNYLKVHDWEVWQSYRRDRGHPPWIKVHRSLLRDLKWADLSDAERGQLVAIWLLAADHDGVIPASPPTIKKLCYMDSEPNLQRFIDLGLLDGCLPADATVTPERRQVDHPETEKSRGEERREEMCPTDTVPPEPARDEQEAYCAEVFECWISHENLTQHPQLTAGMKKSIKARLKGGFTSLDICIAIARYSELVADHSAPGYNRWGLQELCSRGEGSWLSKLIDPTYTGINGNLPPGHSKLSQHNSRVVRNFLEKAKTHE